MAPLNDPTQLYFVTSQLGLGLTSQLNWRWLADFFLYRKTEESSCFQPLGKQFFTQVSHKLSHKFWTVWTVRTVWTVWTDTSSRWLRWMYNVYFIVFFHEEHCCFDFIFWRTKVCHIGSNINCKSSWHFLHWADVEINTRHRVQVPSKSVHWGLQGGPLKILTKTIFWGELFLLLLLLSRARFLHLNLKSKLSRGHFYAKGYLSRYRPYGPRPVSVKF